MPRTIGTAKVRISRNPRPYAHDASPDAAHYAISRGRGVAFIGIHRRDRNREFRTAREEVREAAAEFSRRAVIVRGRILNIGAAHGQRIQSSTRARVSVSYTLSRANRLCPRNGKKSFVALSRFPGRLSLIIESDNRHCRAPMTITSEGAPIRDRQNIPPRSFLCRRIRGRGPGRS